MCRAYRRVRELTASERFSLDHLTVDVLLQRVIDCDIEEAAPTPAAAAPPCSAPLRSSDPRSTTMPNRRHRPQVELVAPLNATSTVRDQCVAKGDRWVHLRACLSCGPVGCCDQSKNKHATKH